MMESAEEIQAKIEQLECRWMIGSGEQQLTHDLIPLQWQPLLGDLDGERQALLALAIYSQHQAMLFEPEAATGLSAKPDLPDLNIPCLPPGIRACFRRVLAGIKQQSEIKITHLLQLLFQRGFSAHPADWLPSPKDDDLPAVYWSWCSWVSNELSIAEEDVELTAQTWNDFYPAERLRMLRIMRLKEPLAARELIQACALQESAEKRLKIIGILATNLSQEDSAFLQSLTKNRSQKVALLATQYLARLGIGQQEIAGEDMADPAQDLGETFELKKAGLLNKGYRLLPVKLKSKKQQAIRSELLQTTPLLEFAKALHIETERLLASWQFSNNRDYDNQSFLANAINTVPDNLIHVLLKNILRQLNTR